jgi:hypothetical protein
MSVEGRGQRIYISYIIHKAGFWMEEEDTINVRSTFPREMLSETNAQDEKDSEHKDKVPGYG